MTKPLDESYFVWLYGQVADVHTRNPKRTYWKLLRQLYSKEFEFYVDYDENRAEEGKYLRYEFMSDGGLQRVDPHWLDLGCSMLELMVVLSRRLVNEADGRPHYWFMRLLENTGLARYNDTYKRLPRTHIDHILEDLINRRYNRNGLGGFFPLREPPFDQRRTELWYQLDYYVMELERR